MLKVQTHTSSESAFFVNSHLIHAPEGIVVVDTQFLLSEAEAVREAVAATGRPLAAIIVTHPHPDHFNGTTVLLKDQPISVPVYATEKTVEVIKATEAAKREQWVPVYGDDYPQSTTIPTNIVDSGEVVSVGGLTLRFEDLGEMESANQTIVYAPEHRTLFCGDLVYHRVHPWLAEGRSAAWQKAIEYVQNSYSDTVAIYSGHGSSPVSLNALNEQLQYITFVQNLVKANLPAAGEITADSVKAVSDEIEARYPNWPLAMLHEWNIQGVAQELQQNH